MMTDKQKETEEQIFEAAQRIFQRSGYAGARMQEIADEAGINKSMLHYYYRSKDKLFQAVFQEGLKSLFPLILKVLNADMALRPKVEKLVETYYDLLLANPHLPQFVIHEMNQHPERFREFVQSQGVRVPEKFIHQIQAEVASGSMKEINAVEFIINIVSLCLFPFVAHNMVEVIFDMDDSAFRAFIKRRKKTLPGFILNAVKFN